MTPRLAALLTAPADDGSVGAIFGLFWGMFATTLGLLLATNYRGILDRFLAASESSASALRRIPPWRWIPDQHMERQRRQFRPVARIVGGVFAVVGPLVLVASAVQLVTRPWRLEAVHLHPHVTVFGGVVGAVMLLGFAAMWLPARPGTSLLRDAWRQGRVLPRLAAAGTTVAALVMVIGVTIEVPAVFTFAWAAAVIPIIILALTWHRSPAPPPATGHQARDEPNPTDPSDPPAC